LRLRIAWRESSPVANMTSRPMRTNYNRPRENTCDVAGSTAHAGAALAGVPARIRRVLYRPLPPDAETRATGRGRLLHGCRARRSSRDSGSGRVLYRRADSGGLG